jgi:Uma2 family endonuclease
MVAEPVRRRFDVDEYHWMGRVGILRPDERVELLDGEIVTMSPIGNMHNATVDRANQFFTTRLAGTAQVRTQGSIRLSQYSEPEPDIALLRPRPDFYASAPPTPVEVLLIIEVADSSLASDRNAKLPLYAAAGIIEVWLVDLQHRRITVYREPEQGRYLQVTVAGPDSVLSPIAFPDLAVTYADIFGK